MTFRAKVPACAVLAAGLVIMPGCARGGVAVDADRGVYLVIVGTALALVLAAWGLMFLLGAHPAIAERAGRWAARQAQRVRPGIDPEEVARSSQRLASLTWSAMTERAFWESLGLAASDLPLTCSRST